MGERDYAAEMRALIDDETGDGPYMSRLVAHRIVERLTSLDPDLLHGWLMLRAEQLVWDAINSRDRSRRTIARGRAKGLAFADAAAAHEGGDSRPLRGFLETAFVIADGTRCAMASLKRDDLLFVAGEYERRSNDQLMSAAFCRAIAKRLRTGMVVADRFTNAQLDALWRSIGGPSTADGAA